MSRNDSSQLYYYIWILNSVCLVGGRVHNTRLFNTQATTVLLQP